jgi:hypothetical protein
MAGALFASLRVFDRAPALRILRVFIVIPDLIGNPSFSYTAVAGTWPALSFEGSCRLPQLPQPLDKFTTNLVFYPLILAPFSTRFDTDNPMRCFALPGIGFVRTIFLFLSPIHAGQCAQ